MERENRRASDVLQGVVTNHSADKISFREIKIALHERGFGLLLLLFALPLSIPLPLPPGATALPSIPLILFSIQMLLGYDAPWLPKWVEIKTIDRLTLAKVVEKASPVLIKIERFLRPRLTFAASKTGEKIIGLFALLFSISIAIPLPLTNMVPAVGITLMSLGLLSKDGVLIIIGMIVGCIGLIITTLVILFGAAFVYALLGIAS